MAAVLVFCRCGFALLFVLLCVMPSSESQYQPTWKSLDTRPLPKWYDQSKIGIFIHWGVFSVPSFSSEWFWYYWKGPKPVPYIVNFMKQNYRPDFTYADFAPQFTAEFFNPDQWAEIFAASGARYIVFVTKHHEGFTNWPSKASFNWNSMDVGPKRDIVGELTNAIRKKTDLHMGFYHSLFEWFNPLYNADMANNWTTHDFVSHKTMPELYELINTYKPDILWSDGIGAANSSYWNATHFLAWLYNESPVKDKVVTNDRWGRDTMCKHGGFYTCQDRYNPGTLQKHKWENCLTLDKGSWGYRRVAQLSDILTMKELTTIIAESISCGGNVLINVGPTHDGRIVPVFEERLRQLGQWLKVNGEAVYESVPWTFQNDTLTPKVWYTQKKSAIPEQNAVYAFVLDWPKGSVIGLDAPTVSTDTEITLLGYPYPLTFMPSPIGSGVTIDVPEIGFNEMPCDYAWVFKMTNVKN